MASPLKKVISYRLLLVTLVIFSACCPAYAQPKKYIRVAIIHEVQSLNLKVNGAYEITGAATGKVLSRGKNIKSTITGYQEGILIAGKAFPFDKLFIKTGGSDVIVINNRTFRGDIKLIKSNNMKLSVINYIELEDYIKGISIRETSHYWPPEVLKAEAIVFRTFALYKIEESVGKEYDLTSDIYSQVYSGRAAERYRINKAVDQTRGKVLMYRDKIFPAFYHATCAGHTEDASLLWNIDLAPLKGRPCDFCKDSPHFKWHYVLTKDEIKDRLVESGYKIKNIKAIQISGRDKSGRITELNIDSDNKNINITAKDFRELIGPNIIKSTNFQVSMADDDVIFEGLGWGHGVGLCQWGAYFMAKQGCGYEEILKYYYPQSDVKTLGF